MTNILGKNYPCFFPLSPYPHYKDILSYGCLTLLGSDAINLAFWRRVDGRKSKLFETLVISKPNIHISRGETIYFYLSEKFKEANTPDDPKLDLTIFMGNVKFLRCSWKCFLGVVIVL